MRNESLYDERGKFIGAHGSPEHKAHIATRRHQVEVYDALEALLKIDDYSNAIENRAQAARDLEAIKEDTPEAYDEARGLYEKALADAGLAVLKARRRPISPIETAVGDVFTKAPSAPPFVVDGLIPRAHGVENAVGGTGKTTRHIWEAVHIILGRELYGRRILQPGGVVIVTKEDDAELFRHRIHGVIAAISDISAEDRKRIAEHLHLLVLTGTDERLAIADRSGNLVQTDLAERIASGYLHEGIALVEFDPFNLFGPGERFINDGEAATLSAMANISRSLGCAVRGTAHVSKAAARGGTSDAHTGRGGSASGDNSRFVWNFWAHDSDRDKGIRVPRELVAVADAGELYRLDVAKLTAARSAHDRIWIVREGFAFDWRADVRETPDERRRTETEEDDRRVLDYLRAEAGRGVDYTAAMLEGESKAIGVAQKRIRAAVDRLKARGLVEHAPLPKADQRGGRKTYLRAVEPRTPKLDTETPITAQFQELLAPNLGADPSARS